MSVFGKAGRRGHSRDRNRTARPIVELFEERMLLATFTVTDTGDNGDNSNPTVNTLRWAVQQAELPANAGSTIDFNITTGPFVINLNKAALLPISQPTTINGTTQPGYTPGNGPVVVINGTSIPGTPDGLTLAAGSGGSTILGLEILDFSGSGIVIQSAGNTIGDATGDGNVLGSNGVAGVQISGSAATGNVVTGNFIGTDSTGKNGLANGYGVQIFNAGGNTIGGTVTSGGLPVSGNTIGFSTQAGVAVFSGNGNAILENTYVDSNGPDPTIEANDISLSAGANKNQAPPAIQNATLSGSQLTVDYTVSGASPRIEFYEVDSSSTPMQRVWLGSSTNPTTATITPPSGVTLNNDDVIVATVTTANGTSMFSAEAVIAGLYTVTNTKDSGSGSLRQAILNADNTTGQTITFHIKTGPFVINLSSPIQITALMTVDGTTESSVVPNTVIQVNGGGQTGDGLVLTGASGGSTIKGLDIVNFTNAGIHVQTSGDIITGNIIGADPTGQHAGPGNQFGILIDNNSNGTVIGGSIPGAPNIVAFNTSAGVSVDSGTGNTLSQNLIYSNVRNIVLNANNNANHNQNAPVLTSVIPSPSATAPTSLAIQGSLTTNAAGSPNDTGTFLIEFFAAISTSGGTTLSPAAFYLGSTTVTDTTGLGNQVLPISTTINLAALNIPPTDTILNVTATATSEVAHDTSALAASEGFTTAFTIKNTEDYNPATDAPIVGSLRYAIANSSLDQPVIFDIPAISVPGQIDYDSVTKTWQVALVAPITLDSGVKIDGAFQPGFLTSPVIEITAGTPATGTPPGEAFVLAAGSDDSTISNLAFTDFSGAAVEIQSDDNQVTRNDFGLDIHQKPGSGGPQDGGNGIGVLLDGTASGNSVSANEIGFNATGISIGGTASGNSIQSNYIGTDPARHPLGNAIGIAVAATGNSIGGPIVAPTGQSLGALSDFAPGNIIGFSTTAAISLSVSGTVVQGNFVGTDLAGDNLMVLQTGNAKGAGIVLNTGGATIGGQNSFMAPDPSTGAQAVTTLEGNVIGNIDSSSAAISITGVANGSNTVTGNYLGVDPINPGISIGNGTGIMIGGGSQGNSIGGQTLWSTWDTVNKIFTSSANVIGFNSDVGIKISGASGNRIQANYIGTEPGGYNLANGDGILIANGSRNTIGGQLATATRPDHTADLTSMSGNIIAFSTGTGFLPDGSPRGDGILIEGSTPQGDLVRGNYIGTDPGGSALGNTNGVEIRGSTSITIGVVSGAGANIISANGGDGILIDAGAGSNTITANIIGSVGNAPFGMISGIANGTGLDQGATVSGNLNGIHVASDSGSNSIGSGDYTTNPSTGAIGTLGSGANTITGNLSDGIRFDQGGSADSISGNLISQNGHNGINIDSGGGVSINDNLIGTDSTGSTTYDTVTRKSLGNLLSGIQVSGTTAATISGNVVSGNGLSGIVLSDGQAAGGTPLRIEDNLIGTDSTGTVVTSSRSTGSLPFGNVLDGIQISRFTGASIGGPTSGGAVGISLGTTRGNLISGNLGRGIELDSGASGNTISANLIGVVFGSTGPNSPVYTSLGSVDANGSGSGNLSDGVFVLQGSNDRFQGNVISGNRGYGIHVSGGGNSLGLTISGDFIGTNQDGSQAVVGGVTPGSLVGDGQGFGNGADGVFLDSAGGITVSGNVISANRANGVDLLNARGISIVNNKIGTDVNGGGQPGSARDDFGNAASGVFINESSNNTVGGALSASSNIIAGNHGSGVFVSGSTPATPTSPTDADSNLIAGNDIGISPKQNAPGQYTVIPNAVAGIILSNASNNTVGGSNASAENVISGNSLDGILLVNDAVGNVISYNRIGTDASGVGAVPNSSDGLFMLGSSSPGISIPNVTFNAIPSSVTGNTVSYNTISGNSENGVQIFGGGAVGNAVFGNDIGLAADGNSALINGGNKGNGVVLNNDGGGNLIGRPGSPNIISGNAQSGILIFGTDGHGGDDVIQGNKIGTNSAGSSPIANGGNGVFIYGTSGNMIGGNTISGNAQAGVTIFRPAPSAPANSNTISGNLIGGAGGLGNLSDGIDIYSGLDNTIGRLDSPNTIVGNGGNGVLLLKVSDQSPDNNTISGNDIGIAGDGTSAVGNRLNGILVQDGTGNRIGVPMASSYPGSTAPTSPSNVISGNGASGVAFTGGAAGNFVQGNYIGVGASGSALDAQGNFLALGNDVAGVFINNLGGNSSNETIGGPAPGSGNIIGGNYDFSHAAIPGTSGVSINGPVSDAVPAGNVVAGNLIGIDAAGNPSGNDVGVFVENSWGNTIGGTAGNVISANAQAGVELTGLFSTRDVVEGNEIGTNAAGNGRPGQKAPLPTQDGTAPLQTYGVYILTPSPSFDPLNRAANNQVLGNLISGNLMGINITGVGSGIGTGQGVPFGRDVIAGNLIGTDWSGNAANPNFEYGVYINNSAGNTVGGTGAAGNVISANGVDGVEIFGGTPQTKAGPSKSGAPAARNVIIGNTIGYNKAGGPGFTAGGGASVSVPDGPLVTLGRQLYGVVVIGSSSNIIGGKKQRNVIGGNISTGVYITVQDFNGNVYSTPTNNTVSFNTIVKNGQYGAYRFESPKNSVARIKFGGNPINLADFLKNVGVNTLPAPKSRYPYKVHSKPAKASHARHPKVQAHKHGHGKVSTHARPRIPALFQDGVKTIRIEHVPARRHR
jgi:parallel beta-helix repeat protein